MNILIVDDKPNLVRVTAMALRTLGCHAFTASNRATATHVLDTEKIDAVFLDVNLSGDNGLEFLSQLTGDAQRPPVIIFTSQARDEIAGEARSRGAFDCLIKPFTLDDLRDQMARIEQHSRVNGRRNPSHAPNP